MRKVYISIPITGYNLEERKRTANEIKKIFIADHYEAITPFDVCNEKDKPYSYYMGKDIEVLLECSHICFVDGWKKSKGCRAEKAIADIYGIKRIYIHEEPNPEPQFEIGELVMMRLTNHDSWTPEYFSHKSLKEESYYSMSGRLYNHCVKFDKDIVFTNKPAKQ